MSSITRLLLAIATTLNSVSGQEITNAEPSNELPSGVLHFPLTRRSLSERVELTRRDTNNIHELDLKNRRSSFAANLKVGSDNQTVTVLVDTGSSDLWLMSSKNPYCSSVSNNNEDDSSSSSSSVSSNDKITCYRNTMFDFTKSSTFRVNNTQFNIRYGDGTFANGSYCQDHISYGSASIKNANFALANYSDSSTAVWGIGLTGLEAIVNTYDQSGNFSPTYSNLPVQMKEQGLIDSIAYSLWLNDIDASNGSLLFGGIDHARYDGNLQKVPLLSTYANAKPNEFQIKLDKVTLYQDSQKGDIISCSYPALLDSGTTYMMLPQPFLDVITGSIGGACTSQGCFSPCNLEGGLTFDFSGIEISVPFSEFLFNTGSDVCLLGMLPSNSIIMGDTFLRSAYVVYDLENYEIALAKAVLNATSSSVEAITNDIPSATQAPSYSSTSVASTYSTSYATFFTTNKGSTVNPTGTAGSGGTGATTSSRGFGNPFGNPFGFLTTLPFSQFTATGGGRDGGKSSNGVGQGIESAGIFSTLFTSILGLILYI